MGVLAEAASRSRRTATNSSPPETSQRIALAQSLFHGVSNGDEKLVSHMMAVSVVDVLEPIDIEVSNCDSLTPTQSLCYGLFETIRQ
jgi:hypothetical protein